MQVPLKKALFILSGLAMIAAGFFLGKLNIVQASVKEGQKFEDWSVSCIKNEDKQQVCLLNQQYQITKDNKTETLAAYQVGYMGKDKKLVMVQILPLSTMLQPGTAIISDDKLLAPGKFTICNAQACKALAELSDEDVSAILNASTNFVGYMNFEVKQISIPLSNKGLKEGLAALKK